MNGQEFATEGGEVILGMDKERLYTKFIPVGLTDIAGVESWLGDMSEQGYFLSHFVMQFGRFYKGVPERVRYRLEPVIIGYNDDMKRRQLYEESGWRYVTDVQLLYQVFAATDSATPELHTDPRIQSYALDRLMRRLVLSVFGFLANLALLVGLHVLTSPTRSFLSQLILYAMPLDLAVVILWLLIISKQTVNAARIVKLRKQLRSGVALDHKKSYQKAKKRKILNILVSFITLALVLIDIGININALYPDDIGGGYPLPEPTTSVPVLRLGDVEGSVNVRINSCTFLSRYSILTPAQYTVTQDGWVNESTTHPVRMTTDFYETVSPLLAKTVFEDKRAILLKYYSGIMSRNELETPLFDGAVYLSNHEWQYLIVYKADRVLDISYYGNADLTEALPLIAEFLSLRPTA